MRLQLTKFMSHESSELELPSAGVVVVVGPNGAGKSAIAEALSTAMWGRGLRGARWSPWRAEEAGHVEVNDPSGLWVDRRWTGKGKQLRWALGDEAKYDTTSKAQEALESIVGNHEVWRRTSVFSASDAAHFTMASDSERKELLESLLGLGWFDRALQACRRDLHAARVIQGSAARDVEVCRARLQALSEGIRRVQAALDGLGPAQDVGLSRVDVHKLADHLSDADRELKALLERRNAINSRDGANVLRASQIDSRLAKLSSSTTCPLCQQAVSEQLRESMVAEAAEALRLAEQIREESKVEASAIDQEMSELHSEVTTLRSMLDSSKAKLYKIESTREVRENLQRDLREQGADMAESSAKLLADVEREKRSSVDVAELEACEQVLGTRGARAHLVGRTLRSVEALANTWLSRLDTDVRIELSPYTEKKSGGVVDSISLALRGAGGESGYAGASAGERRRVDVAVLLSLADLASGVQAGARWRSPLFFDEVFDSLDGDGREAVGELISDLAGSRCVVVITHDEALASVRADLRLRVDDGRISSA